MKCGKMNKMVAIKNEDCMTSFYCECGCEEAFKVFDPDKKLWDKYSLKTN